MKNDNDSPDTFKTDCLLCGQELQYFQTTKKLKCGICQTEHETTAACTDNHFICDDCHAQPAYAGITSRALQTRHKNPKVIACEMMKNPFINMHGPEHHYLIIAALLAAFKNVGGDITLKETLATARQRAQKVPGGICGFWGCCGAGVGAGIFVSIITSATPLSVEAWRLANKMTAKSLDVIADNGGPRCCKRNVWLAVTGAIKFVKNNLAVEMENEDSIKCTFFTHNASCKQEECIFYPGCTV